MTRGWIDTPKWIDGTHFVEAAKGRYAPTTRRSGWARLRYVPRTPQGISSTDTTWPGKEK